MSVIALLSIVLSIHLYLKNVDVKAKEFTKTTDANYTFEKGSLNAEGLYVVDLKEELSEFIKTDNAESISCHFKGEKFVLEVFVKRSDDETISFELEKVVEDDFGINARVSLGEIESIEYRTGEIKDETLLKINTANDSSYFAMIDGVYYFLGQDIETISYMDQHFYYVSYNPKYKVLREAEDCSKEVKASIKNFKTSDYYYKYGKINFLSDFYQKLSTKVYTVKDRCEELQQE